MKQDILFKNVVNMFYHRGIIKEEDIESVFNTIIGNFDESSLETSCEYFSFKIVRKKVIITCFDTRNEECFHINEIILNPYSHKYSPRRIRILDESDKIKFLNEMDISFKSLPQMKITDPIARYLNLKLDMIIEIERNSKATITSLYYRRIIK